ncbi:MAG: hypothetical protein SGILL_001205 [Bacillariaceae sp.]
MFPTKIVAVACVVAGTTLTLTAPAFAQAPCTPCAAGEPTCDGLDTLVAGLLDTDSNCQAAQLANYQNRCCPGGPPYNFCPICPDGSEPPGLNNEMPTGEFVQNPTCNEFQFQPNSYTNLIPGEEGNCADTFLQRVSHYCGCPGVQHECFLCPDGSAPGNPDRGEAWATNANCRGLEFLFSAFTADECSVYPDVFGVDFAAFCVCPGVEEPPLDNPECSICNGQAVVNPDFQYASKEDGATFDRTCAQAENFARYITTELQCGRLLEDARIACCPNGSIPDLETNTKGAGGLWKLNVL